MQLFVPQIWKVEIFRNPSMIACMRRIQTSPIKKEETIYNRALDTITYEEPTYYRLLISEYLQKQGLRSARLDPSVKTFNKVTAVANYRHDKSLTDVEKFRENFELTQKTISLLVSITNLEEIQQPQLAQIRPSLPNYTFTDIPPIPQEWKSIKQFEHYIYQLTHTTYMNKAASSIHGKVPHLLRSLFSLENSETAPFRSTQSYNSAIYFFQRKGKDIASAREFFQQIRKDGLTPNTVSYNTMLLSLRLYSSSLHSRQPLEIVLHFLSLMKRHNVKADLYTWTLIFGILPGKYAQAILIKVMEYNEIPILPALITLLITEEKKHLPATKLMSIAETQFGEMLSIGTVNEVTDAILEEKRYLEAWKFVLRVAKKDKKLYPKTSTLFMFAKVFAKIERPDLILGCYWYLNEHYGVRLNVRIYHQLIKAAVKTGFHRNWRTVIRMLYAKLMQDTNNTSIYPPILYWLERARIRAKILDKNTKTKYDETLHLSNVMNEEETKLWREIKDNLKWTSDYFDFRLESKNAYIARKLGAKTSIEKEKSKRPKLILEKEREHPTRLQKSSMKYRKNAKMARLHRNHEQRLIFARAGGAKGLYISMKESKTPKDNENKITKENTNQIQDNEITQWSEIEMDYREIHKGTEKSPEKLSPYIDGFKYKPQPAHIEMKSEEESREKHEPSFITNLNPKKLFSINKQKQSSVDNWESRNSNKSKKIQDILHRRLI